MMSATMRLQLNGVQPVRNWKNVWLITKIRRTQSLWWWTLEPVGTSPISHSLPVCVVWWLLQTDGLWNCQSCQTSAKVCQYSKCSSLLTVLVKGWPIRPLRQPTQDTWHVVWLTLPKTLLSVRMTVELTVDLWSVPLLMARKWSSPSKNVWQVVIPRNRLNILKQVQSSLVQILWFQKT